MKISEVATLVTKLKKQGLTNDEIYNIIKVNL